MKKLDFIHIGLGKCMSTRLQSHWDGSENCHGYSGIGIAEAYDQIIKHSYGKVTNIESEFSAVNINMPPIEPSAVNLMSSENFTFSYLNEPELGDAIPLKDEAISKTLGGMTNKVLLMVRDPIAWIKSCYAQQIKEGGCVPFKTYLNSHRSVILNNLNLERRIELWSSKGAEVIVLPIEISKRSDDEFWHAYEQRLNVPRPQNWQQNFDIVKANITGYGSIEAHRQMNQLMYLMESNLEKADFPNKTELLKIMKTARLVGVRQAFTFGSKEMIEQTENMLGSRQKEYQPDGAFLDLEYLDALEKIYLMPLRNDARFEEYGFLQSYCASVDGQQETFAKAG